MVPAVMVHTFLDFPESSDTPTNCGLQGFQSDSSPFHHMRVEQSSEGDVVMTTDETLAPQRQTRGTKDNLDGMNALLRAGEIVGRGERR